jgi:hypothetical protein
MFDPAKLSQAVSTVLGNKPHPDLPEVKVNQYEAFGRVAARMFGNSQPLPGQVRLAYHSLTSSGISPAEFERLWDTARPLANELLDRDPTLHDMTMLQGAPPNAIADYYATHPHPEAPDVPAGKINAYRAHAAPVSQVLHGRDPNIIELHRFATGNYGIEDILAHYHDDGSSISGAKK